jgi:phospholipid/cholesterol/gamma-HCH transport system ATP-binding protein
VDAQHEDSLIRVQDLHKSFGKQKVLDGISVDVPKGQTLAVLGRSGTGKSVLLKLLIGLMPPDSGSISVHGQTINGLGVRELNEVRKKIGFLFQQAALYDSMTVEENVAFPLGRHSSKPEAEQRQRAKELLASVGMERDVEKLPSEISGGMQKRVGLARALALDPEIILFDEPTAGLDPITADEIGALIVDLKKKRNMTSVVVTHDIRGARKFADRLVMIHEGRVVAEGSFQELEGSKDSMVSRFMHDGG